MIRRAALSGNTPASSPFKLAVEPQGSGRRLTGETRDAGGLLRLLDVMDTMQGGRMTISGTFDDTRPEHPLSGTAEIDDFRIRNAPVLAKLLQAMTLYGLVDAARGPGLGFTKLVAPFRLADDTLTLSDARAFSASLGMTAKGQIDLARQSVDMQGTIVPAYFFNSLLGNIPLVGKFFSPERGGGVFAATYAVRGKFSDPDRFDQSARGADAGVFARAVRAVLTEKARARAELPLAATDPSRHRPRMSLPQPRAVLFDVFGTVVDWRGSLIADLTAWGAGRGVAADWAGLVDAWRGAYAPSMDEVRHGTRPWTVLDDLHRASLERLLPQFGLTGLAPADISHINGLWHRLRPWPDSVAGLTHLRESRIVAALSNGNVALLVDDGEARRTAVGHGVRRRRVSPLQARPGDLSRRLRAAAAAAGRGDAGRRPPERPCRCTEMRAAYRVHRPPAGTRTGPQPPAPGGDWDYVCQRHHRSGGATRVAPPPAWLLARRRSVPASGWCSRRPGTPGPRRCAGAAAAWS